MEKGLRVVLPTALALPITAYGGRQHRAWYDYLTDRAGAAEDDICQVSLEATRRRICALADAEAVVIGGHHRVLLGGLSQGCCAAFDAFARHERRLAGFVGMVGHPLGATPVADSVQLDAPCWFFNGAADDFMRPAWVQPALQRLEAAEWQRVETAPRGVRDGSSNFRMHSSPSLRALPELALWCKVDLRTGEHGAHVLDSVRGSLSPRLPPPKGGEPSESKARASGPSSPEILLPRGPSSWHDMVYTYIYIYIYTHIHV